MYDTAEQTPADHLLHPDLDERGRQAFAKHLRQFVFTAARGAAQNAFAQRVAPGLAQADPAAVRDRKRVRAALVEEPEYQFFSDLHRISQEMIWNSVLDTLDRTEPELRARFRALAGKARGTLQVDPDLEIPRYLSAVDIHCMPGGYPRSEDAEDLIAGALYDRGGYLYSPGNGAQRGGLGRSSLAYLRRVLPDFRPKRILDLGCGIGGPTLAYSEAFPDAEIHALDAGAAMVRYGHLRAETLGHVIHFSQQDAAHTNFAPGSFDLVLSHIMFHESSATAAPAIIAECRRLLAPGGVMLHVDLPPPDRLPDVYTRVIFDGDAYYNNEPFWMRMHDLDWPAMLRDAGFDPARTQLALTPVQVLLPPADGQSQGRWVDGPFPLSVVFASVPA